MSTRYLSNLTLLLLGAFLVVVSQTFGVNTFMWLMLAGGIAALAVSAPAIALVSRGRVQRSLDGLIAVLGIWTIVASVVFAGATVGWLGFASGLGLAALATIGLTLHELKTERVVHSIELAGSAEYHELAGVR